MMNKEAFDDALLAFVLGVESGKYSHEMRREMIDTFLCKKWPFILGDRNLSIDIEPGWIPVIDKLCAQITDVLRLNPGLSVDVMQIKEKFGTLRFYAAPYSSDFREGWGINDEHIIAAEEISNLVSQAEEESSRVCETCGKPGQLTFKGWSKTLCARHAPPEIAEQNVDLSSGV